MVTVAARLDSRQGFQDWVTERWATAEDQQASVMEQMATVADRRAMEAAWRGTLHWVAETRAAGGAKTVKAVASKGMVVARLAWEVVERARVAAQMARQVARAETPLSLQSRSSTSSTIFRSSTR